MHMWEGGAEGWFFIGLAVWGEERMANQPVGAAALYIQ